MSGFIMFALGLVVGFTLGALVVSIATAAKRGDQ